MKLCLNFMNIALVRCTELRDCKIETNVRRLSGLCIVTILAEGSDAGHAGGISL